MNQKWDSDYVQSDRRYEEQGKQRKTLSIARKLLVLNRLTYEEIADAVNKMEGVPVRSCVIELSNAWSEGKITGRRGKRHF